VFICLTDYRYGDYGNGLMESGTHAMEAITALIDGPLCFLVAFAAVQDWGCRHPFQIILCVMQLYGLLWFVLQPIFSDTGAEGHFSSDPVLCFSCYPIPLSDFPFSHSYSFLYLSGISLIFFFLWFSVPCRIYFGVLQ
jgi:hypothetical protein